MSRSASEGTAMIKLTTTQQGIRVTRGAESYTVMSADALAVIIARLLSPDTRHLPPATAPANAPAVSAPRPVLEPPGRLLGQRLAAARQRHVEGIR
jgi:hypothetical protein